MPGLSTPRKQLMVYDSSSRPVCYDHHLRVCDVCSVDYRSCHDRVFILDTGINRFMPQWDEQLLGPLNTLRLEKDYSNPPKPLAPDQLYFHYCNKCRLTWLEGENGPEAAQCHPSHHTYAHSWSGTSRSLMVFVNGTCTSNGSKAAHSAVGICFGSTSPNNISKRLDDIGEPIKQSAEIAAAVEALRYVKIIIEPARRTMIQRMIPPGAEIYGRNFQRFRLIVATDSSYVVECMCKHMENWTLVKEAYRDENRAIVENSEGFVQLNREVEALSMVGVQVAWYHVPREHNQEAAKLAQMALTARQPSPCSPPVEATT